MEITYFYLFWGSVFELLVLFPKEKAENVLFGVVVVLNIVVDEPKVLDVEVVLEVVNENPVVVVLVLLFVVVELNEKPTGLEVEEVVVVLPKDIGFDDAFEVKGLPNPKVDAVVVVVLGCPKLMVLPVVLPNVIDEELLPNVNFGASFGLSEVFLFGLGSSQQIHLSASFLFLASQTLHFHSSAAKVGFFIPAAAQSNPVDVGLVSVTFPKETEVLVSVDSAVGLPKVIEEEPPNVNFGASFGLSEAFLFGLGSSQQTHLSASFLFLASQTLHFHSSAAKVGFFIPAAAQLNPVIGFDIDVSLSVLLISFDFLSSDVELSNE